MVQWEGLLNLNASEINKTGIPLNRDGSGPPVKDDLWTPTTIKLCRLIYLATAWGMQQQEPGNVKAFLQETWRRSDMYGMAGNRSLFPRRPYPRSDVQPDQLRLRRSVRREVKRRKVEEFSSWPDVIKNPKSPDLLTDNVPEITYFLGRTLSSLDRYLDHDVGLLACMNYAHLLGLYKVKGIVPMQSMSPESPFDEANVLASGRPWEYGLIAQLPVVVMTSARLASTTSRIIRYLQTHGSSRDKGMHKGMYRDLLGSFYYAAIFGNHPSHNYYTNEQLMSEILLRLRDVLVQALLVCMTDEALSSKYETERQLLKTSVKTINNNLEDLGYKWSDFVPDPLLVRLPSSERLKPWIHPEKARAELLERVRLAIVAGRW